MDVVRKTVLDPDELDICWSFYDRAFDGLRDRSATRHSWTRNEFDAMMNDPRVDKFVAQDPEKDDRACALATLTNDLGAVPWVSPEFYAARWPEHFAQDKVWYVPFLAVDPNYHRAGVLSHLIGALAAVVPADGGVIAFDTCTWNEEALQLSDTFARLASSFIRSPKKVRLDTQTYWGYEFASSI